MKRHDVVVLGGGVGGTLVANLLSRKLHGSANVRLLSDADVHRYQPGLLYVPFGEEQPKNLVRRERPLLRKDVELIFDAATRIDLDRRRIRLASGGELAWDQLVIATGSHLDKGSMPGFAEGAHEFYSVEGAERLRGALERFEGGRIVIGVAGIPYKCPVAPLEFTFLLESWLRKRNLREKTEITYTFPLGACFTIPSVAAIAQERLDTRGIVTETFFNPESIDPSARRLTSLEGTELDYDLLVLVPPHRGAAVITDSGLGDAQGWLPTDRETLHLKGRDDVYVMGDATDLPLSKAGSTAHHQAPVIAERIAAAIAGREPDPSASHYRGHVQCFIEMGDGQATMIDFDFDRPPAPRPPTTLVHLGKKAFNRAYWALVPTGRV